MVAALALGAAACWGVADFLGGVATRRVHVLVVALVSQASGAVSIAVVVLVLGVEAPPGDLVAIGLLTGVVNTVAVCGLYASLAMGTMARVAPVLATGALVPVAVGLASGDEPTALQFAGLPLAMVGVVLVSREARVRNREAAAPAGRMRLALAIAAVASLCLGTVMVGVDHISEHEPLWAVLILRATTLSLIGLACVALVVRGRGPGDPRRALAAIPVGLLDTSANVLFAFATNEGLLSLVAVLSATFPAVTVILSLAVLRERLDAVQAAGVLATLTGIAMIVSG